MRETRPVVTTTVEHTKFRQYGNVRAICRDDKCAWKHVAKTLGAVNRAAVDHARTGHEVEVERNQWKIIRPA